MAGEGNSEMSPVSHEDKELEVEEIEEAEYRYDGSEYGAEYGYEEGYEAEYGYEEGYEAEYGYEEGYEAEYGNEEGYEAEYGYEEEYGYGAAYEEGFEAAQNVLEEEFEDVQIEEELPESLRIPPSDIRIGKQIGRGGFSTVHKAFWRGQACEAKVVQTTDVGAIQREVAILSKLDHPHVIRCIGFSVDSIGDPSRCMILMELMDEDLRHVMDKRLARKRWSCRSRVPFSEAQAVNILEQIAAGMEYLHEQRVFHGDLKASNILVSHGPGGKMHVKITDFGVSQMVKRDPTENTEEFMRTKYFRGLVGTRAYQAPEVSSSLNSEVSSRHNSEVSSRHYSGVSPRRYSEVSSRHSSEVSSSRISIQTRIYSPPELFTIGKAPNEFYTAKADTYCFAKTCYEILSGRVPFEDVKIPDIPELVLRGARPRLPETVDQQLKDLIEQCWHEKASKRPSFRKIRVSLVEFSVGSNVKRKYSCAWPTFCLGSTGTPRQ